jgi:succinate dehydrogenase / fumarate reductase cytochrome b subunit
MSTYKRLKSSVGRKVLMALSGIALMLFLIVHLGGNLTLFVSPELFNSYAYHLESLGPLLYVAEAGLLVIVVYHIVTAIQIQLEKRRARGGSYAVTASKGGPSKQSLASRSMIITGLVLLAFIPIHVVMFKFNWFQPHGTTQMHGETVKDLYGTVAAHFKQPGWVLAYVAVMLFLGFHLRHGFWSSLQSLGAMNPKCSPLIYCGGLLFAALMAGGFLILPIYIFLKCGGCCGGAP